MPAAQPSVAVIKNAIKAARAMGCGAVRIEKKQITILVNDDANVQSPENLGTPCDKVFASNT